MSLPASPVKWGEFHNVRGQHRQRGRWRNLEAGTIGERNSPLSRSRCESQSREVAVAMGTDLASGPRPDLTCCSTPSFPPCSPYDLPAKYSPLVDNHVNLRSRASSAAQIVRARFRQLPTLLSWKNGPTAQRGFASPQSTTQST